MKDLEFLDTTEAAELLGVSRVRVLQLIRMGRLKAAKFGRDWMLNPVDVKAHRRGKPGRPTKNPITGSILRKPIPRKPKKK